MVGLDIVFKALTGRLYIKFVTNIFKQFLFFIQLPWVVHLNCIQQHTGLPATVIGVTLYILKSACSL